MVNTRTNSAAHAREHTDFAEIFFVDIEQNKRAAFARKLEGHLKIVRERKVKL